MKKYLRFLSILAIFCLLSGCVQKAPEEPAKPILPTSPSEGTLEPYSPPKAPKRWYEDYTDTVIPRDDYGMLLPYVGGVKEYFRPGDGQGQIDWYNYEVPALGLCTESGMIVTDPVFDSVYLDDGCYILTKRTDDGYNEYTLCAQDGSYCINKAPEEEDGQIQTLYSVSSLGDGFFACVAYDHTDIISKTGELVTRIDGYADCCGKGRLRVYGDGTGVSALCDIEGNIYGDDYGTIYEAGDYYIVSGTFADDPTVNTTYGIIDRDGNVKLDMIYDEISCLEGIFVLQLGNTIKTLDNSLNEIASFSPGGTIESAYILSSGIIAVTADGVYHNYTTSGEIIPIDDPLYCAGGIYYTDVYTEGNVSTTFFDKDFKKLSKVPDGYSNYGRIIDGRYAVLTKFDERDGKSKDCVFDVYEGKFTDEREYDSITWETVEKDGKSLPLTVEEKKIRLFGSDEVLYTGKYLGSAVSPVGTFLYIAHGCDYITLRPDGTKFLSVRKFDD